MTLRAATLEKRETLKLDLQQEARQMILEQGYKNVSVRKLATRAGCAVGMVYTVYRDFDDLMFQVNGQTLQSLYRQLKDIQETGGDPVLTCQKMGRAYIRFAEERPHLWAAVFEHLYGQNGPRPAWYQQIIDDSFALLEQVLQPYFAANPRKCVRAARVLWAGLHGITMLARLNKLDAAGSDSALALSDSLVEHYLSGMRYA